MRLRSRIRQWWFYRLARVWDDRADRWFASAMNAPTVALFEEAHDRFRHCQDRAKECREAAGAIR